MQAPVYQPYAYTPQPQVMDSGSNNGIGGLLGALLALVVIAAAAYYLKTTVFQPTAATTTGSSSSTSVGTDTSSSSSATNTLTTVATGPSATTSTSTTGASSTATTGTSTATVTAPTTILNTSTNSIIANLSALGSGSISSTASGVTVSPGTSASVIITPCTAMKNNPSYSGLFGTTGSYGGLVNTIVTPASWTDDQRTTAITIVNNAYPAVAVSGLQAMTNSALASILACTCPSAIATGAPPLLSTPPGSWTAAQRSAAVALIGTPDASVQPNEALFAKLSCSGDAIPGYCGTEANYNADTRTTVYSLAGNCPGSNSLHFSK